MKRKRKRTARMRGSRTHGCGSKKKQRGSGSRGGKGFSGTKKQKKTWVLRYEPDHIGKFGFRSLEQRGIKKSLMAVNVGELERLAGGKKELDLSKHGYGKVLGGGRISSALTVKAYIFTEKAKAKIENAKGKAVQLAEASDEEE